MARRGENIYFRKDRRYEGRFIKGYREDRKPIYGSVYARKYSECKVKLTQMKLLHSNKNLSLKTCGSGNVKDFLNYWLYGIIRQFVKESTFANYVAIAEKWLIPFLGKTPISRLGREDVQQFVQLLSEHNLSAGTIKNIFRILYAAMKKAEEFGYIHINPCTAVRLPEQEKKEARLLSLEEQKRLEQTAKVSKYGAPILLAMYTGMRVGEICALKWCDLDLESGIIRVSSTRKRIKSFSIDTNAKTRLVEGSAKSMRSMRVIPLPKCILLLLKRQKTMSSNAYVFTCKNHPLEPRILQYRFQKLIQKAGIRTVNFHALRHTFATRCLELNFDIKTLSDLLGHASAKLTLDRYGHSQMEHKRAAMQSLDHIFDQIA